MNEEKNQNSDLKEEKEEPVELHQEEPAVEQVPEEAAEAPAEEAVEPAPEPTVVYRWDYDSQRRYNEAQKKKSKKGAFAFAGIVITCFLLVLGMLAGVLAFRDYLSPRTSTLSTVEISELLLPSTVLITATNDAEGASGSGFFIRQDGYIATNYHVVEGMDTIQIKTYHGDKELDAKLIGYEAKCDLAVLKVEGSGYPAVTFGNSSALKVGETAIAIGNPAGSSAQWTVTQGIISSVERALTTENDLEFLELKMIQTDAAVNPGNSGGLLCNGRGEVIGVVARKQVYRDLAGVTVFDEGIGFAIPGNGAKKVLDSLILRGTADGASAGLFRARPKIGMTVQSIKKGEEKRIDEEIIKAPADGVLITAVSTNGANGLLQAGDIIYSFDGKRVTENAQLIELMYSYKRGDKVKVKVYKKGETKLSEIQLTLGIFSD